MESFKTTNNISLGLIKYLKGKNKKAIGELYKVLLTEYK
jgi:hypothetical protein